jgi:hypothetical protein
MLYSEYREPLEASAAKWFAERPQAIVNPRAKYILADHNSWPHNLVDERLRKHVEEVRPRHTYVHHGLSSQALCFNLFGSLLLNNALDSLRPIVNSKGGLWPEGPYSHEFEFNDITVFNETRREQPTSWDFAIRKAGEYPFALVEVKFVETSVGACSVFARGDCNGDCPAKDFSLCYLQKEKGRKYWDVFQAQGLLTTPAFAGTICPLTIYYQFYREVTFAAARKVQMLFIYDDRNPVFGCPDSQDQSGLLPLLLRHLPPTVKDNIKLIPLRELVRSLYSDHRNRKWLASFASKYDFADETDSQEVRHQSTG